MKEYQCIEDGFESKKKPFQLQATRYISHRKKLEHEKSNADPLKIQENELPKKIMQKIDLLIREKLANIQASVYLDQVESVDK